jgi:hypothetical protein
MGSQELTPEEKFKGILIFKYLKTGKITPRKGLLKVLFYLAGEYQSFRGVMMTSSSTTQKRPSIDRTAQIKVKNTLNLKKLFEIFDKFLINFETKKSRYTEHMDFLTVYYSSQSVQWALIDEELRVNHKENINEQSGFPKVINFNYEKK